MIVVSRHPILFGPQPELAIPGYVVISQARDFTLARKEGTDHFICDYADRWELWPIEYREESKSPNNPAGQCVADGKAIVIPKP